MCYASQREPGRLIMDTGVLFKLASFSRHRLLDCDQRYATLWMQCGCAHAVRILCKICDLIFRFFPCLSKCIGGIQGTGAMWRQCGTSSNGSFYDSWQGRPQNAAWRKGPGMGWGGGGGTTAELRKLPLDQGLGAMPSYVALFVVYVSPFEIVT